jgi:hypothetical protein
LIAAGSALGGTALGLAIGVGVAANPEQRATLVASVTQLFASVTGADEPAPKSESVAAAAPPARPQPDSRPQPAAAAAEPRVNAAPASELDLERAVARSLCPSASSAEAAQHCKTR